VEIEVRITATTEMLADMTVTPMEGRRPDPPEPPRHRFIFSDDLIVERIDDLVPGTGLPQSAQDRLAGTHSGFATTLRVADANDRYFPVGSMLFQYEGTFLFDAVTAPLPAGLPSGQVIARGVALFDRNFEPLRPLTFAIVGGTGPYQAASGQVAQPGDDNKIRLLTIVVPRRSS
jgi:hypothetical protein